VRLVSPVEGADRSRAAIAHVDADRAAAVLFAYQLEAPSSPAPTLQLTCLDAAAVYRLRSTDLSTDEPVELGDRTGEQLAVDGLPWPLTDPCTARIWELERR
jgi:alpha-galactosidase